MPRRHMLFVIVQAVLAVLAIGCAAALYVMTTNQVYAVMVAIVVLSVGQLIGLVVFAKNHASVENHFDDYDNALSEMRDSTKNFGQRLDQTRDKFEQVNQRGLNQEQTFATGLSDLRQSYSELALHLSNTIANPQPAQTFPPAQFSEPMAKPEPASAPTDSFATLLEPIVDINTGATTHYRLQTTLVGGDNYEVPHDVVLANADQTGTRAVLDQFVVREALSLLERLRQRNPKVRIFMSLGVPTLFDQEALQAILSTLHEKPQRANGLVMELPHTALVSLSEQGIVGLALLARSGVAMALTDVAISGLDLPSLRHLGVKYFGMPAKGLFSVNGLSSAIVGFSQSARAMQFQIIVTDVSDARMAAAVPQLARFASGPLLGPPRRVKSAVERDFVADRRFAA